MAIASFSAVIGEIWHMSMNLNQTDKGEGGDEIFKCVSKPFNSFSSISEAGCADTQKGEGQDDLRIKQFKEWMHEYDIQYPNEETRQDRFSIFKANVELHGYDTYKEYRAALDALCYNDLVQSLHPSKIDWVEAGVVSPVVRNQGACGCCWAMAVVASVEALNHMKTNQSITLSVQELIDCERRNNGCKGRELETALAYVQVYGLSAESSNPYKARSSILGCKRGKTVAAARITGFKTVPANEYDLEKAVAKQPVVVSLQSSSVLETYKDGIIDCEALPASSAIEQHTVLIVGYGTDPNGIKYWRFKNSWGQDWGEGGFGRIRRHLADEQGALGMFTYPLLYPVFDT